jgi:hypothetical protein
VVVLVGMGTAGLVVAGGWYEWRSVRVRPEVVLVCDRLAEEADGWRAAYRAWQRACARRDQWVAQAERRVMAATGGLGYARWRAVLHRRRFRTVADAKLKARALRARPAVEAAEAERDRSVRDGDAEVAAAAFRLAEISERVTVYGSLAERATGTPVGELRRLARLCPGTGRRLPAWCAHVEGGAESPDGR